MTTDYMAQSGVSEIRNMLAELRHRYVYIRVMGDADPQPYKGFISAIGEATVEIIDTSDPVPAIEATALTGAEEAQPAMRERTLLRIDHILSATEVTIAPAEEDPAAASDVEPAAEPAEVS